MFRSLNTKSLDSIENSLDQALKQTLTQKFLLLENIKTIYLLDILKVVPRILMKMIIRIDEQYAGRNKLEKFHISGSPRY